MANGRSARSARPGQATDVHLGLELVGSPLTRGGNALVKVRVHKDRPGLAPTTIRGRTGERRELDPASHRITWEWTHSDTVGVGNQWRPTIYMERVSAPHLEQNGPTTRTAIYAAGLGKREHLVTAVKCLVDEGNLCEDGSRLVPAATPFRHDEARSRIPKPFPAVPGTCFPPFPPFPLL